MTERTWHKGPPPHIGWWNASMHNGLHIWRWWDGCKWSNNANCYMSAKVASNSANKQNTFEQSDILWSDYYPKNARVPRIDPRNTK